MLAAQLNYSQVEPIGRLLSDTDLAKRWKVSLRTIQRWRQAGRVPTYLRLGRQISYRQEDVAEYEEAALIRAGVPQ